MTSGPQLQRAATDVKHSKQYPACLQCQQRHVKCSNTLKETGFPCEACIERGVPAQECMSHFDDPHWIPGVSGATHKRGRVKASRGVGQRQKKQRNVKAARQEEDEDVVSEDEDDEFQGPTVSNSGPRRSTRSKLQEGGYREDSEDEQPDVEDADHRVLENEPYHGEDTEYADSVNEQETPSADKRATQAQPDQSAEVQPDNEADRLMAIEAQLGAAAERPAVQMILRVMRERLDEGEHNVIARMRYLLARAAGQPPTF
ncbi:unnamed protein product [Cercospora beticola]|nr:unnamed protein product [Cercospora beticola]